MRKVAKFNADAYAILEATSTQSKSQLWPIMLILIVHSPTESSIGKQDSTPSFENNSGQKTRET
jgi:hypothetical protein